jgi:hypothetical protein
LDQQVAIEHLISRAISAVYDRYVEAIASSPPLFLSLCLLFALN